MSAAERPAVETRRSRVLPREQGAVSLDLVIGVMAFLAALAHRGPDGQGVWQDVTADGAEVLLAHRRLAVIDPTPAGAQPTLGDAVKPGATGTAPNASASASRALDLSTATASGAPLRRDAIGGRSSNAFRTCRSAVSA